MNNPTDVMEELEEKFMRSLLDKPLKKLCEQAGVPTDWLSISDLCRIKETLLNEFHLALFNEPDFLNLNVIFHFRKKDGTELFTITGNWDDDISYEIFYAISVNFEKKELSFGYCKCCDFEMVDDSKYRYNPLHLVRELLIENGFPIPEPEKNFDILSYAEKYKNTFLEKYVNLPLSELPKALGMPCGRLTMPVIGEIPSVLETSMVAGLLKDETFSKVEIMGVISSEDGMDAFVLSISNFSISEDIAPEDRELIDGSYLCYCIFVTEERAWTGITTLDSTDLELMEPFGNDSEPVSCLKELLPVPGNRQTQSII